MTSSSSPHAEIVGADAAMADLRKWADQVAPAVAKDGAAFGRDVADKVAGRVPVLTGQLADSVTSSTEEDGISVGYDGSAPYDGWIEFGGSRGRPHISEGRYLYPSALDAEDEFATVAGDIATKTAERFSWSTPKS